MSTNLEVENRFIAEQLDIQGEYMVEAFIAAIDKKDLVDKGNLIESFRYRTDYSARKLSVSFLTYGRVHDLKSRNSLRFEKPDTNALLWGIKPKTRKKKRNKQWYARTAYGSLGVLTNNIMYGLSDIERTRITTLLAKQQQIKIEL